MNKILCSIFRKTHGLIGKIEFCRNKFDNNVVTNFDFALTFLQTPYTLLSFADMYNEVM